LNHFAERLQLRFLQNTLEIQINLHARHLQQMRDDQFDLQSRRLNAFFREKLGAALNDFENCHCAENWCNGAKGAIEMRLKHSFELSLIANFRTIKVMSNPT